MNFQEVRTMPRGKYRVDIDWKYLGKWLSGEVTDLNLDLDPDFQRGHVWTEDQQSGYIEYILKGGTSGKELYFNHPNWMGNWEGEFVIVDGKQRMEAVLKFMRNELKAFGLYYNEFDGPLDAMACTFHVNIASVKTREEVLQWYLDFNAGGTPHSQEEISKVRGMIQDIHVDKVKNRRKK